MTEVTVYLKSGNSFTFQCGEFISRTTDAQLMGYEAKPPIPNDVPLFISMPDIEAFVTRELEDAVPQ